MMSLLSAPRWMLSIVLMLLLLGMGIALRAELRWATHHRGILTRIRRLARRSAAWRRRRSALYGSMLMAILPAMLAAPAPDLSGSAPLALLLLPVALAVVLGLRWLLLTGIGSLAVLAIATLRLGWATQLVWLMSFVVVIGGLIMLRTLTDSAHHKAARYATESRRHRDALRESELRFRLLVERLPAITYVAALDEASSTIYTSPQIETILGFPQDEWMADPTRWLTQIHPDDRARVLADVYRSQESGQQVTSEYRMLTRAGAVRWFRDESVLVRDDDGRPRHVQGVMFDITDRKAAEDALRESEERYRLITERSTDLIMLTRATGAIVYASPSAQAMLGRTPTDLHGQSLTNIMHDDDVDRVERGLSQLVDRPMPELIVRLCHVDGSWRWAELAGTRISRNDEDLIVTVARDITERRSLERQLLQAQKLESVGRLAGGVAHDFNNLLMAIAGCADMGRRALTPDHPLQAELAQITHLADRAETLVRQLLLFARRQVMEPRILTMNSLIMDMEKLLRRLIGEHIELIANMPDELGWVRADPAQIEQVIINMAVNAHDAMPDGGRLTIAMATVTLDAARVVPYGGQQPGDYVRLTISDTGTGMSEEVGARLFEPFFTTKEPGKGTGLGLSTCYGIVEQHGGHIAVASELGRGTTFTIDLPRVVDAEGERVTAPVAEQPARLSCGDETILLVEDEEIVRTIIAWQLRDLGYTVLEAGEPIAALRLEQAHTATPIHLLLTDVVMPHLGGRELAAMLGARQPDLKVVYMSGYSELAQQNRIVDNAMLLHKPFNQARLAQALRAVLDGDHSPDRR